MKEKISIFWFRRDLRLEDQKGLFEALRGAYPVLPIFIFDQDILQELSRDDARVSFIYDQLSKINEQLKEFGSALEVYSGKPHDIWKSLIERYSIQSVYFNKDYEPYSILRDQSINELLNSHHISCFQFKDQVIFEEKEILKQDQKPYTVFTPYSKKWKALYSQNNPQEIAMPSNDHFSKNTNIFPSLASLGFHQSTLQVRNVQYEFLDQYMEKRDYPAEDATSYLSAHLRFGTIGIRELAQNFKDHEVFLNELIWREFFKQILFHFPRVVNENFKRKYDGIAWRNKEADFKKWCHGKTGYPLVDAGMRQLNSSGYMHNRVRMITAGFLCKHLLIDWRWGEAYFAEKLLDYDLSSNNGNWQWAAGTGCDAAPYFRVFNPHIQLQKFDKNQEYIQKWIPEIDSPEYPAPMIEHKAARKRALEAYKLGIE